MPIANAAKPTILRARERLIVIQLVDDIVGVVQRAYTPGVKTGRAREYRAILQAVFIGHLRGRRVTVHFVSRRMGMPRATVIRRLAELVEMGTLARDGPTYYPTEKANNPHHMAVVERCVQLVLRAADELRLS